MPQPEGTPATWENVEPGDALRRPDDPETFVHVVTLLSKTPPTFLLRIYEPDGSGYQTRSTRSGHDPVTDFEHTGEEFLMSKHNPPPKPEKLTWSEVKVEEELPPHGWIGPDGSFYPCGYREHKTVAVRISFHEEGVDGTSINGEKELEDRGYVKCGAPDDQSAWIRPPVPIGYSWDNDWESESDEQWKTARKWLDIHGDEWSKLSNHGIV